MLIPVGAGEVRPIGTQECDGVEWFPDGKRILCETFRLRRRSFASSRVELPTGRATEIPLAEDAAADLGLLPDRFRRTEPSSPASGTAGTTGSCRWREVRLGESPARPSATKTRCPVGWTADGRKLFVHHEGEVPDRVQKLDLATGRNEPWKELDLEDRAGIVRISPVRVAADGRSWAYSYVRVLSNLYVVDGLK